MALTLQFFLIFVFSTPYARRYAFRAFWIVHLSYPLYFILMILHGAGRMIQAPFFYYFMLGPVILFILDQLISFSRRAADLTVVKADLLPSGECILISIDQTTACTIATSLIHSKIDYCNSLLSTCNTNESSSTYTELCCSCCHQNS